MTLDELRFIRIQLIRINRQPDEIREAIELIDRDIKLKTLDPRKSEVEQDIHGVIIEEK